MVDCPSHTGVYLRRNITPSSDWFALQLHFAEHAAAITGLSFDETVLHFTNCYRRFGLGHSRDPDHPIWQDYLRGLHATADQATWTAEYCRTHAQPVVAKFFGCFYSEYLPDTRTIRLHFANNDDSGAGPLSRERLPYRLAELRALFSEIARVRLAVLTVRGVSWLHGIEAYRRLYPLEYGQSAHPVQVERAFPSMPLWGQFLDHGGCIKENLAGAFLACLGRVNTITDLAICFPHQVYAVECEYRALLPFLRGSMSGY